MYNITYSVALFALFVFYKGAHTLLAPFNPMLKFLLVKSVVFFTFWQAGGPTAAPESGQAKMILTHFTCTAVAALDLPFS